MNLNGKKIVITGGAGFIGSALAHYFDENFKDTHVLVVDKFRNDETFSNAKFMLVTSTILAHLKR